MIIVEGMDNTGKTTLVERLLAEREWVNNPLKPIKSPGPCPLGEGLAWCVQAIKSRNPRKLYDRFHPISERVYGPVVRPQKGDMYGGYTFDLLRLAIRREPVMIYCRPPDAKIEQWGERKQMDGVKSHALELARRYDWLMEVIYEMSCGKMLFIKYDYTRGEVAYNEVHATIHTYLASHDRLYEPMPG